MIEVQSLQNQLIKKHSFTEKEADFFVSHFTERKVKKRQFIIQPEFIAKYRIFIVQGTFKAYVIDKNGQEQIISLAMDGWWISDPNSFIYQQPATMFVEALEDSVILQLDFENEQILKAHSHKFETFFRTVAERGLAFMQRRLIASLTLTAEERYEQFAISYPDFLQRVPQFAIASYLGMTTQYLSRIRKNQIKS
ncbi:Crp/Fnr family transcriptional regulator [uncultured Flavobacterium sp.]|uniref:Crp/Fnr family transcriptional regulator n=1 Tax=uncultured Flavobacterium sp. TaxID=165435 RepID=UPI0030CA15DA